MSEIVEGSSKVPEWNTYYPSLLFATEQQRRFYEYWRDNLERGVAIDIKGNLSYLFVYLYGVVEQFIKDKDIDQFLRCFVLIRQGYSNYEKLESYLSLWTSHAWLYLNNYDKSWEAAKTCSTRLRLSDVISIRANCTNTTIDGHDLLRFLGNDNGLTPFGKAHLDQIASLTSVFLEDFHRVHKANFIEFFCTQFDYTNLTDKDMAELEIFFTNKQQFKSLQKKVLWGQNRRQEKRRQNQNSQLNLFWGVPISQPTVEYERIPAIIEAALTHEGKRILRECENTLREESNIPRVGEGWISEAELFYKLREAFPDEKVVHHGRPAWLYPQHLDIYFPGQNVGCEYQGAQHQNPVSYFGGEASFLKQQRRDRRKKTLCTRHGCKLLYVYEGYDFKTVRAATKSFLMHK